MDFNKKYFGVPLAVIILLIGIGIATAASLVIVYETTIQGSVTVEETTSSDNYEITVYETSSCEHELTSIDCGTGKPGDHLSPILYIKNTGDSYIPEVEVPNPAISAEGWETMGSGSRTNPLEVGEMKRFYIYLWIKPDAQPGDYSGEIKIIARASE